ncbi:hypothetical protein CR513_41229, partial [Mucuna pruriens]
TCGTVYRIETTFHKRRMEQTFQDPHGMKIKIRYLLNSKAINCIMYALTKAKYKKVHSYKSLKEMYVLCKRLQDKYKLFKIEDHKTIINNLRSLAKTTGYNAKIVQELKKLLKELLGTLKVHELNLQKMKDIEKFRMLLEDHRRKLSKLEILQMKSLKKKALMRMNSPSYLESSTPFGRRKKDLDGKISRRSLPKRIKTRVEWYAMSTRSLDTSSLNV